MNISRKKHAIILDIDGTLCDNRSIIHMLDGTAVRDYDGYHIKSIDLPVHPDVLKIAQQARMEGLAIIVVTARPDLYQQVTYDWLLKNNIPMDELHMRRSTDFRSDDLAKKDILNDIRKRYDVVHAVDDNPLNVALFKAENISVTVVPGYDRQEWETSNPEGRIEIPSPIGNGRCLRCGRKISGNRMFGPDCAKIW